MQFEDRLPLSLQIRGSRTFKFEINTSEAHLKTLERTKELWEVQSSQCQWLSEESQKFNLVGDRIFMTIQSPVGRARRRY